jgi:hypothetical protein
MPENYVSASGADSYSPDLEDLCVAMFLEGARILGISLDAPISLDAQAKILQAANSLGEKLAILLEFQNAFGSASELGN